MTDLMFELPNKKNLGEQQVFTVTKDYARQKLEKADYVLVRNAV